MRSGMRSANRLAVGVLALTVVFALQLGALLEARAQGGPPQSMLPELVGASVFSADGTPIGEVAAISVDSDGTIKEVRINCASPLGLGARTVVLPRGSYMFLQGAVIVDLSPSEVDALPTAKDGEPA